MKCAGLRIHEVYLIYLRSSQEICKCETITLEKINKINISHKVLFPVDSKLLKRPSQHSRATTMPVLQPLEVVLILTWMCLHVFFGIGDLSVFLPPCWSVRESASLYMFLCEALQWSVFQPSLADTDMITKDIIFM